jgi:cytochrome c oxidase cbb3-type subunit 4
MISGIFTLAALLGFLGVTWWAYTRHNRARFEQAAQLPFTEDTVPASARDDAALPACCREAKS